MCCTFLPGAESVGGTCIACLMTKILFAWTPGSPLGERSRVKLRCGLVIGLTKDGGKTILRWRELFIYMNHAMTDHQVVAMARAWDFVVSLAKRCLLPPSR